MADLTKAQTGYALGRLPVWFTSLSGVAYFTFSDSVSGYVSFIVANVTKTLEVLLR